VSEPEERTALYRIRGEADALLYTGITNNPAVRWNAHQQVQPWWDELRSLTVEWHDSRAEAEAAEKAAILAEQPKYNVTYLKAVGTGRERKPLEVTPVKQGLVKLDPRPDDENLMTLTEAALMARIGPQVLTKALRQTAGPTGFILGGNTLFRRREIRQWIADIEASQKQDAA
jgi:predicted GIY-YIG superfamily endonuclease